VLADVGVHIESAVGLDRDAQTQFFKFRQQIITSLLEGKTAIFVYPHHFWFKAGQRSMLCQAGCANSQTGGQFIDG
jgi:hypothetical protein